MKERYHDMNMTTKRQKEKTFPHQVNPKTNIMRYYNLATRYTLLITFMVLFMARGGLVRSTCGKSIKVEQEKNRRLFDVRRIPNSIG